MKNKYLLILLIFSMSIGLKAQDADPAPTSNWTKGGDFGVTFSQVSLTNWAAGGDNTMALNALTNLFANYKKNKWAWDNSLLLAYGLTKIDKDDAKKSDDRIDFASKLGYENGNHWYYTALFTFKSQFTNGYNYVDDERFTISRFLAPAYISMGLGMDYKPSDKFSVYISPATARLLVVSDQDLADAGAFGVDPGDNTLFAFGGFLKSQLRQPIMKNIDLLTKLELYSDYLHDPQNIDVNWDVLITMKVNEYISANLNTNLLYDHDIDILDSDGKVGPRTQFKEVFGVGFSYKF